MDCHHLGVLDRYGNGTYDRIQAAVNVKINLLRVEGKFLPARRCGEVEVLYE
jgi:hypothetical protein